MMEHDSAVGARRDPWSDFHCVEPLLAAMDAAWRHDAADAVAALDLAESFLPKAFHKSRETIERARDAARSGDWVAVWSLSHGATCTLTYNWPPDTAVCPPCPDPLVPGVAQTGNVCASCAQALPRHAKFCVHCGERVQE